MNQKLRPIFFFLVGFLYDVLFLPRIDSTFILIQHGAYLTLIAWLIRTELFEDHGPPFRVPSYFTRVWSYRENALHFLLGALLSSYALFYFKSASGLISIGFASGVAILLLLNEFYRFGRWRTDIHLALWSLCLISFLTAQTPQLFGFLGAFPFLVGNLFAACAFYAFGRSAQKLFAPSRKSFHRHITIPLFAVQAFFFSAYLFKIIPPVPLATTYIGAFHGLKKEQGRYELTYSREWWRFWEKGAQTFRARPGDPIYCFFSVFSPRDFQERLQVRWFHRSAEGTWLPQDAIPISITGGRDEGFRGYTKKLNYFPGKWRVQLETQDGREVGRLDLVVLEDSDSFEREWQTLYR